MLCSLAARCGSRLFSSLVISRLSSHLSSRHGPFPLFSPSQPARPPSAPPLAHIAYASGVRPSSTYRLSFMLVPSANSQSHRIAPHRKKRNSHRFVSRNSLNSTPPRANSSHASISSSYPIQGCKLFRLYFSSSIYAHDGYVRSSVMCSVKLPQSSSSVLLSES